MEKFGVSEFLCAVWRDARSQSATFFREQLRWEITMSVAGGIIGYVLNPDEPFSGAIVVAVLTAVLMLVLIFSWKLVSAPFRSWKSQGTRVLEIEQRLQKEFVFLIEIASFSLKCDQHMTPGGVMRVAATNRGTQQSVLLGWQGNLCLTNGETFSFRFRPLKKTEAFRGNPFATGEDGEMPDTKPTEKFEPSQSMLEKAMTPIPSGAVVAGVVNFDLVVDGARKSEIAEGLKSEAFYGELAGATVYLKCYDVHKNEYSTNVKLTGQQDAEGDRYFPGI